MACSGQLATARRAVSSRPGRHRSVAHLEPVSEVVGLEQIRSQGVAAAVTLATLGIDVHLHGRTLPVGPTSMLRPPGCEMATLAAMSREVDVVEQARGLVSTARHIVVLTGAGISTDCGIPDFRGPNGVWTKNPAAEKARPSQHYVSNPEVRRLAWRHRLAVAGQSRARTTGTARSSSSSGGEARHADHAEHRRPAPARPALDPSGHRGPRHHPRGRLPELRRASADGACTRARRGRRGRSAVPELWRHPEVGDDLVRAVARRRGSRPGHAAPSSCDLLLAVGSTLGGLPGGRRGAAGQAQRAPGS